MFFDVFFNYKINLLYKYNLSIIIYFIKSSISTSKQMGIFLSILRLKQSTKYLIKLTSSLSLYIYKVVQQVVVFNQQHFLSSPCLPPLRDRLSAPDLLTDSV